MRRSTIKIALPLMLGVTTVLAGCHTDMWVQPKSKPQHASEFFEDGMVSRPKVKGTVARGQQMDDPIYFTGRSADGKLIAAIPADRAMTELKLESYKDLLMRGKERYTVFCSPCHGQIGDGKGMIASRGLSLKRPVGNYHTDRLRQMPVGHFFDVMTNGYGVMYSVSTRVPVEDRWAIAAYIRVLQRSQNAGNAAASEEINATR
jgi:mono/diheme cytochrome c family protein